MAYTRVFLNSLGLPTYEAKELGLNKRKFELEPDLYKSVIITGNEINEYFKVLLKVMSFIMPKVAEKTVHLPHGMLRMTTGKMSSRKGNVITGEGLIAQVKELVAEKIKDREMPETRRKHLQKLSLSVLSIPFFGRPSRRYYFDFESPFRLREIQPYLSIRMWAKSVLGKAKLSHQQDGKRFARRRQR